MARLHRSQWLVSRRSLLVGSAIGLSVQVFSDVPRSASAAPVPQIQPTRTVMTEWLSVDLLSRHEMQIPVVASLMWPRASGSRAKVALTADSRLITIGSRVSVSRDSIRSHAELEMTMSGNMVTASGTVAIPDSSENDLQLVLPFSTAALYPNDNLGDVSPVRISFIGEGDKIATLEIPQTPPASTRAWGAELFPGYEDVSVRDPAVRRARYRYPVLIVVASSGPTATPPSILEVALDSNVVTRCLPTGMTVDGTTQPLPRWTNRNGNGTAQLSVDIPPITPGSRLELRLSVDEVPLPDVNSIKYSTVTMIAEDSGRFFQRDTGRYGVVDLTSSGNPLSDDIALGKD